MAVAEPIWTVGEEIRKARLEAELDQDQLAAQVPSMETGRDTVTRQTISNWERDQHEPTITQMRAIATATTLTRLRRPRGRRWRPGVVRRVHRTPRRRGRHGRHVRRTVVLVRGRRSGVVGLKREEGPLPAGRGPDGGGTVRPPGRPGRPSVACGGDLGQPLPGNRVRVG